MHFIAILWILFQSLPFVSQKASDSRQLLILSSILSFTETIQSTAKHLMRFEGKFLRLSQCDLDFKKRRTDFLLSLENRLDNLDFSDGASTKCETNF